jgi:hypothetical protein
MPQIRQTTDFPDSFRTDIPSPSRKPHNPSQKRAGKALSSNPSTEKKERKKEKKTRHDARRRSCSAVPCHICQHVHTWRWVEVFCESSGKSPVSDLSFAISRAVCS